MKKILGTFTFWFVLVALILIVLHILGLDKDSNLLIGSSPLVRLISIDFMNSGLKIPIMGSEMNFSIFWYIGTLISFIIYGLIFDIIYKLIKKARQ